MIDGEAVVIGRRPGGASAAPDIGAARPLNDNRPDPEPSPRPRRGGSRPDLVFPGTVRWPATPERRGDAMFAAGLKKVLVATGCLAAIALAWGFAATMIARDPEHPAPATPATVFALADTRSSIVPHRNGTVLAVEGRIRNFSGEARDVPAVTVRVPGRPGFTRSFRPTAQPLGPGRSLFFHSTLAVPSATTADGVGLVLAGTDWRRF